MNKCSSRFTAKDLLLPIRHAVAGATMHSVAMDEGWPKAVLVSCLVPDARRQPENC